jgi:hypothetical protein
MSTQGQADSNEKDADRDKMDRTSAEEIVVNVAADCLSYEDDGANPYNSERKSLAQINSVNTETSNVFTQHTDPFKKEQVTRILDEVMLGDDLMDKQWAVTRSIVEEFADCFALAMSEVNTVPGVSHQLRIPEGTTF